MKTIKQSVALAILSMYLPHVGLVLAAGDPAQDTAQQFSRSSKAVADTTSDKSSKAATKTTATSSDKHSNEKIALPEIPVPPPLNPSYAWYGDNANTTKVEASVKPTTNKPAPAQPATNNTAKIATAAAATAVTSAAATPAPQHC